MTNIFRIKAATAVTVFAAISLISTGCNEDWLEPKPLSFYAPENTFNEASGLWAAITACERNLRGEYTNDAPPILTELIFTEVAVEGTTDKSGPAQDLNKLITPDANLNSDNTNRIGYYWYEGFKGIKYANVVISRIDEPEDYKSEAERNHLLGTAYFHRAMRYYRLTQQFGDVPLILEEINSPKLDFYSTDRDVILRKMKEDLEFAEEWVPEYMDRGQAPKGAIQHLLIKVNLALAEFDDAIAVANRLIDQGPYALMTERFGNTSAYPGRDVVWDLHRPENKSLTANTEAIFMVLDRYNVEGNTDGGTYSMRQALPHWASNINTPAGNKGTYDRPGVEIDLVSNYGRGIGRLRPTWYSQETIWDDDKDLRHAPGNWMRMENFVYNNPDLKGKDPYYGKPLQMRNDDGVLLTNDTIRRWFDWPHYKLYIPDYINIQPTGGQSDWYIFRLAESYLLRAEAHYWKGDLAAAASDINAVRTRAGSDPYSAADITIGTVLDERARELYYEEPRKTELSRIAYIFALTGKTAYNGKSYSVDNFAVDNFYFDRVIEKSDFYNKGVYTLHGDTYTMSPYHVLWPIPSNTINSNTKGHINQNEGYQGSETNIPPLTTIEED